MPADHRGRALSLPGLGRPCRRTGGRAEATRRYTPRGPRLSWWCSGMRDQSRSTSVGVGGRRAPESKARPRRSGSTITNVGTSLAGRVGRTCRTRRRAGSAPSCTIRRCCAPHWIVTVRGRGVGGVDRDPHRAVVVGRVLVLELGRRRRGRRRGLPLGRSSSPDPCDHGEQRPGHRDHPDDQPGDQAQARPPGRALGSRSGAATPPGGGPAAIPLIACRLAHAPKRPGRRAGRRGPAASGRRRCRSTGSSRHTPLVHALQRQPPSVAGRVGRRAPAP